MVLITYRRDSHYRSESASFRDPLLARVLDLLAGSRTTSSQTITITNFGGAQLNVFNLVGSAGFSEANNCPSILDPGSNCSVSFPSRQPT